MSAKVKIQLGNRPKNFRQVISCPLPEGGEGLLPVLFRYRTRTEFGQFVDQLLGAANVQLADAGEEAVKFSMAQAMGQLRDQNADYLLQVLDGWELDSELTRANVQQLCDEMPGMATAIMNAYRAAITEGRLGN